MNDVFKKQRLLDLMPIITYGTTLNGAYNKMLKLTNTKTSDAKNNRTYAQSMNKGKHSILQAMFYIPTVRQMSIACHTNKGKKGQYYSAAYLKEHIMQCPCIMVWFWDKRFNKLLKDNKLGSLPLSMHFAEKHDIKDIELEYGKYNPEDSEIVLEHKDIRPQPDYIIISSDINGSDIGYHLLQKIFFPKCTNTKFILSEHRLLTSPYDVFEKYVVSNRTLEYNLREKILDDLLKRNKVSKDWRGWINKIRYFSQVPDVDKLNVRM